MEIECEEISDIENPVCTCECVQELKFIYTGKQCDPNQTASGKCIDGQDSNLLVVSYIITNNAVDPDFLLEGNAREQHTITITSPSTKCIPDTLGVIISDPTAGTVTQTFEIDAKCCGKRGLSLKQDYGAFQSSGYTCDAYDVNNCLQEVTYSVNGSLQHWI